MIYLGMFIGGVFLGAVIVAVWTGEPKGRQKNRGQLRLDKSVMNDIVQADRAHFVDRLCRLNEYWAGEDIDRDVKDRLRGLTHSILAEIDGGGDGPPFELIPYHHATDGNMYTYEGVDIAGDLHHIL